MKKLTHQITSDETRERLIVAVWRTVNALGSLLFGWVYLPLLAPFIDVLPVSATTKQILTGATGAALMVLMTDVAYIGWQWLADNRARSSEQLRAASIMGNLAFFASLIATGIATALLLPAFDFSDEMRYALGLVASVCFLMLVGGHVFTARYFQRKAPAKRAHEAAVRLAADLESEALAYKEGVSKQALLQAGQDAQLQAEQLAQAWTALWSGQLIEQAAAPEQLVIVNAQPPGGDVTAKFAGTGHDSPAPGVDAPEQPSGPPAPAQPPVKGTGDTPRPPA